VTPTAKLSAHQRRERILEAAQKVFVQKGFHRATTQELARAAGVSEALLFKHFPSKEALYAAIEAAFHEEHGARIKRWMDSLIPSTASLVTLVRDLVGHLIGGPPGDRGQAFLRLVLRSLMDEGAFARTAVQGGPAHWVRKAEECLAAAHAAGDLCVPLSEIGPGAWFVHQLAAGVMIHALPADAVIDYGVSRDELAAVATNFCLRGLGLKEDVIRRELARRDWPSPDSC